MKRQFTLTFLLLLFLTAVAQEDHVAEIRNKLFNPNSKDVLVVSTGATGGMPVKTPSKL